MKIKRKIYKILLYLIKKCDIHSLPDMHIFCHLFSLKIRLSTILYKAYRESDIIIVTCFYDIQRTWSFISFRQLFRKMLQAPSCIFICFFLIK